MPRKPLKINNGKSFVMRRSPVRVREVAQEGLKVRKCLKTNMLEKSSLFVFAFICTFWRRSMNLEWYEIGANWYEIGNKSVTNR